MKRAYTVIITGRGSVEVHKHKCADVAKLRKQGKCDYQGAVRTSKGVQGAVDFFYDFDVAYRAMPCTKDA